MFLLPWFTIPYHVFSFLLMVQTSNRYIQNISISLIHAMMIAVALLKSENMKIRRIMAVASMDGIKVAQSTTKVNVIIIVPGSDADFFSQSFVFYERVLLLLLLFSNFHLCYSQRHDDQLNSDEISDKKHKHENKDKQSSKHSNHHKSHSSVNEKTDKTHNKHKRTHEPDDSSVSPKKHKKDSSNSTSASSSRNDEKKSSKSKHRHSDDGIEIDNSMGTSFADALGKTSSDFCFRFCTFNPFLMLSISNYQFINSNDFFFILQECYNPCHLHLSQIRCQWLQQVVNR